AELVRPVERHRAGTRKRELLLVLGYDLERRVVVERYGLLRGEIFRHHLEQLPGLGGVGVSNELDAAVESSPLGRAVGGDGPLFSGAARRQPVSVDAALDQSRLDGVGARE